MKTIQIVAVLFFGIFATAQETTDAAAIAVIKTIHGNEVEAVLGYLHGVNEPDTISNEKQTSKTLYKSILSSYKKSFTTQELNELFAFYQTATGKKLLQQKDSIANAISTHIFDKERELMGIEIPEPMDDSAYLKMMDSLQVSDANNHELAVDVLPEINTLEDLRNHLKKQPYDIANYDLLRAILGPEVDIDALFTSAYEFENPPKEGEL